MVLAQAAFPIQPIHDSFACHPCNVREMHTLLRRTFVEMYQQDVLAVFDRVPLRDGVEAPVRPGEGALDLRQVLCSRFMFC